jgi:hypothetical protein
MLTQQLPAYAYQQYSDDPDINAFFDAYSGTNGAGDNLNPYIQILHQNWAFGVFTIVSSNNLGLPVGTVMQVNIVGSLPASWNTVGAATVMVTDVATFTYPGSSPGGGGAPAQKGQWRIFPYQENALGYLEDFNNLNLPVYTELSGGLLDWVANSLYGQSRQTIAGSLPFVEGPLDTYAVDSLALDKVATVTGGSTFTMTDPVYIAILLWNNYKGDGYQFTIRWLKRRIARVFAGLFEVAGVVTPNPPSTYQISVTFTSSTAVLINLLPGAFPLTYAPIFAAAVASGLLVLPFQYTFTVTY